MTRIPEISPTTRAFLTTSRVLAAKQAWEACVDSLPQLILVVDKHGKLLRVNRTAQTWGLADVHEAPGRSVHALLHPGCRRTDCLLEKKISTALRRLRRLDQVRFPAPFPIAGRQLVFSVIRNARSDPDGLEPSAAFIVIDDVSPQGIEGSPHPAEPSMPHRNRLRAKLQLVRPGFPQEIDPVLSRESPDPGMLHEIGLYENPLTGLYLIHDGRIELCNPRFAWIFGYRDRKTLCGEPLDRFLAPVSTDELDGLLEGGTYESDTPGALAAGTTRTGERRWLLTSEVTMERDGQDVRLGCVLDVTAHVEAEKTLVQYQRDLEALAGRLLSAQEEERQRIASELHDSIGQQLSIIRMSIAVLVQRIDAGRMSQAGDAMGQLIAQVGQTIEDVRRISRDLRPPMLDDLGVVSATEWFCAEIEKVCSPIRIIPRIRADEGAIPEAIKASLFRILQEACHNACRHSAAETLHVVLETDAERVWLAVRDNGVGFDPEAARGPLGGFGLSSMRERAKLSGGQFEVRSAPGQGTQVEVSWPV